MVKDNTQDNDLCTCDMSEISKILHSSNPYEDYYMHILCIYICNKLWDHASLMHIPMYLIYLYVYPY